MTKIMNINKGTEKREKFHPVLMKDVREYSEQDRYWEPWGMNMTAAWHRERVARYLTIMDGFPQSQYGWDEGTWPHSKMTVLDDDGNVVVGLRRRLVRVH